MVLTPDEKTLLRNRYRHFRRENEVTAFERTLGWYRRWYRELVGQEMSKEHGKDITDFVLKLESEMEMPHLGHAKHLCYLAESGGVDIESYKALVKNAKFLCKHAAVQRSRRKISANQFRSKNPYNPFSHENRGFRLATYDISSIHT